MENWKSQLRDIEGLDQLSFWPLAPIWWILIAIFLTTMIVVLFRAYKKAVYMKTWQYDATCQLEQLEQLLKNPKTNSHKKTSAHKVLVMLSELIKRIIIQTHGRKNCANLTGDKLLQWLQNNDANKYDWQLHGKILIEKTYAPDDNNIDPQQVAVLIKSMKQWVKASLVSKKNGGKKNV